MNDTVTAQLNAAAAAFRAEPTRRILRRRYARALVASGELEAADALIRAGLSREHARAIDRAIHTLFTATGLNPASITTRFTGSGQANFAFLRHDSTLLGGLCTKVVGLWRPNAAHEVGVNRALMAATGPWPHLTPRVLDVRVDRDAQLALITSEWFEGANPQLPEHFEALLSVLCGYASPLARDHLRAAARPSEGPSARSLLDRRRREWQRIAAVHLLRRERVNARLFHWLDTPAGSLTLWDWLQRQARILLPRQEQRVAEIARQWRRRRSWRRINRERDYTLSHGDFGPHNVLVHPPSGRRVVIDFNSLVVAPPTVDLARALAYFPFRSDFIQATVLPHLTAHAPAWLWNPTQRLLFFSLLLTRTLWLMREGDIERPAEDLEPLVEAVAIAVASD